MLVNGLPLVQVELKKRGVAIREAFNQMHRYSKESFNSESSLFKYLQIFVISNGTDTRYFANTTKRDKNSFDFTMNWAQGRQQPDQGPEGFHRDLLPEEHAAEGVAGLFGLRCQRHAAGDAPLSDRRD